MKRVIALNQRKRKREARIHRAVGPHFARIVTMVAQSCFGIGEEGKFHYRASDGYQRYWEFDYFAERSKRRIAARLRMYRGSAKHQPILWVARDFARQPRRTPGELFEHVCAILRAHREPIADYRWTSVPSEWQKPVRFFALEPPESMRPGRRGFLLAIPDDPREPAWLDSLVWNGDTCEQRKTAITIPQLRFYDVRGIARVRRSIAA